MRRIWSIDTTRIVAIFFVVIIHTNPFNGVGVFGNTIHFVLDSFARFAVPFFFMTSGYFYSSKMSQVSDDSYLASYVRRLVSLYALGITVLLPLKLVFVSGQAITHGGSVLTAVWNELLHVFNPINLLYYGSGLMAPLWFLPALIYSILLITALKRIGLEKYLLALAGGLHLIGLFGHGLNVFVDVSFRASDALFVGFFYTVLGARFTEWREYIDTDWGPVYLSVFLVASLLRMGEVYALGYVFGETGISSLSSGVYTVGYTPLTIVVAVSLFTYLLSRPTLGKGTVFPKLGEYAVGVYILHPALVLLLRDILARGIEAFYGLRVLDTLVWHLLFTPVVFTGSLCTYVVLERSGVIDRFYAITEAVLEDVTLRLPRVSGLG